MDGIKRTPHMFKELLFWPLACCVFPQDENHVRRRWVMVLGGWLSVVPLNAWEGWGRKKGGQRRKGKGVR
jgi:hypothetical protein